MMEVDSYDNQIEEEEVEQNQDQEVDQQQQQQNEGTQNVQNDAINELLHGKKKKVQKLKKKLTVELLKSEKGFKKLQSSISKRLQNECKGPGHETHDLRRLIEGYRRWQLHLFPSCSFEEFINKLERLGATNITKVELREMREQTVQAVEAALEKDKNDVAGQNDENIPDQENNDVSIPQNQSIEHNYIGDPMDEVMDDVDQMLEEQEREDEDLFREIFG